MDRRHPHLAPFFTPHAGRRYAAPGGTRAAHRQSVQLPSAALGMLASAGDFDGDEAAGPVRVLGSTKRAEHPVVLDENADGSNGGAWAWDVGAGSAMASSSAFPSPLNPLVPGAHECSSSSGLSSDGCSTTTDGEVGENEEDKADKVDEDEETVSSGDVVAVGDPQLPRRVPSLHHSMRSSSSVGAGAWSTVPTPKIPALDPGIMLADDDDGGDDTDVEDVEEEEEDNEMRIRSMSTFSLGSSARGPVPVLPVVESESHSLFAVSVDTVARLLEGGIPQAAGWRVRIIDCRFPYEYAGGHIVGAENLTVPGVRAQLAATAFEDAGAAAAARRTILLFHCEFSSARGPATMRALRAMDRDRNGDRYPAVDYEQIYLVRGGYAAFHARHPHLCTGRAYVAMNDPRHSADCARLLALFQHECPTAQRSALLSGDGPFAASSAALAAGAAGGIALRPGLARSATFHALRTRSESAQPCLPTVPAAAASGISAIPLPDPSAMVRSGSARLVSRFSLDADENEDEEDVVPLDDLDIDLSSPVRAHPPRRTPAGSSSSTIPAPQSPGDSRMI